MARDDRIREVIAAATRQPWSSHARVDARAASEADDIEIDGLAHYLPLLGLHATQHSVPTGDGRVAFAAMERGHFAQGTTATATTSSASRVALWFVHL
jgi:hypothetical protein